MNEIVPAVVQVDTNPTNWTNDRLQTALESVRQKWGGVRGRTAALEGEVFLELARLWPTLRARGLVPDGFKLFSPTVLRWLPELAAGTLLPGLLSAFKHTDRCLVRLAELSLDNQARVLSNAPLEVWDETGSRPVPPLLMTPRQLLRVVYNKHILTPEQQAERFAAKAGVKRRKKKKEDAEPPERHFRARAVPSTGELRVGNSTVPIDDALKAIALTRKDFPPPPLELDNKEAEAQGYETLGVMMPRKMLEALNRAARRTKVPARQLAFNALCAYMGWTLDKDKTAPE